MENEIYIFCEFCTKIVEADLTETHQICDWCLEKLERK